MPGTVETTVLLWESQKGDIAVVTPQGTNSWHSRSDDHFHETILAQSDLQAGSHGSVALRHPAVPMFVQNGDDVLARDVNEDLQQTRTIAADLGQCLINLPQNLLHLRRGLRRQILRHFDPASDAGMDDNVGPSRGIPNPLYLCRDVGTWGRGE